MKSNLVKVIIPIYNDRLSENERISLDRTYNILNNYPIVIIKPYLLNLNFLSEKYPALAFESFDDDYFRSLSGYNKLMLSEEFYERFADTFYVLICQLDAYIFKDELKEWCLRGYDYVGAPWLIRPIYRFSLLRFTSWIKKQYCDFFNLPNGQITNFRVGNGGFSLRKTESHLNATKQLRPIIQFYLSRKRHHIYNEDVFWAVEVNKQGLGFRYPDCMEALQFSFDKYPKWCYKLNNYQLPFGCHSWYKRKMKKFWFPIILNSNIKWRIINPY
ncbi:hypothetical protein EZS27_014007 [termite gut metagenome]|uniref:DUF5672 domain-containing protein n=1 Tax=termite gut metagenome TaxID=433724 RepID=A0A5J4RY66_9ZZZZ